MGRALITLLSATDRERAKHWVDRAPVRSRVEFKAARRSLEQNAKLWASLSDIASQVGWFGKRLTTNQWKIVFLDALKRESQLVPNIDGTGFVDLGRSSSDLTKDEMSQLIEIILCFGAQHGVIFHDKAEETTIAPQSEPEKVHA